MAETSTTAPAAPVPVHAAVFAEGADLARIVGARCRQCGTSFFPRRTVCAQCLSTDVEIVPLSTRGALYTYTIVHQSTPEFATPYILAYGDLREGVRVLAPLAGLSADDVRIGMALELRVEPVRTDAQGRVVMGYRWYPAADAAGEVRHG